MNLKSHISLYWEEIKGRRRGKKNLEHVKQFITSSQKTLEVLSKLSIEQHKKIALIVDEVTKYCSSILLLREDQIVAITQSIPQMETHLSNINCILKELKFSHPFYYFRTSIGLICHKLYLKKIYKDLNTYNEEISIYKEALTICKEFKRRLQFYLSFE